jgi:hypothetical protein
MTTPTLLLFQISQDSFECWSSAANVAAPAPLSKRGGQASTAVTSVGRALDAGASPVSTREEEVAAGWCAGTVIAPWPAENHAALSPVLSMTCKESSCCVSSASLSPRAAGLRRRSAPPPRNPKNPCGVTFRMVGQSFRPRHLQRGRRRASGPARTSLIWSGFTYAGGTAPNEGAILSAAPSYPSATMAFRRLEQRLRAFLSNLSASAFV